MAVLVEDGAARSDEEEEDDEDNNGGTTASHSQQQQQQQQESNKQEQQQQQASASGDKDADAAAGNFDCNICLELAQDPVVTFCGHLFCWPCLYKWMQLRAVHKECPVCKAPVQEEKVIPLYGRGFTDADPSSSSSNSNNNNSSSSSSNGDMIIPSRPPGRRPDSQAVPWHDRRLYDPYGIGFIAGAAGPTASARFGNITLSAGFGLFPSLFRLQFDGGHGFPDLPYGSFPPANHHHQFRPLVPLRHDQQEALLSRLLLFVGGVMILCFFYF